MRVRSGFQAERRQLLGTGFSESLEIRPGSDTALSIADGGEGALPPKPCGTGQNSPVLRIPCSAGESSGDTGRHRCCTPCSLTPRSPWCDGRCRDSERSRPRGK